MSDEYDEYRRKTRENLEGKLGIAIPLAELGENGIIVSRIWLEEQIRVLQLELNRLNHYSPPPYSVAPTRMQ